MPDFTYYPDEGGILFVTEMTNEVLILPGIPGPPGPQGATGPMGPPNMTPISLVAGNGLTIAADGGLFVNPPSWGSTNW